MKEWQIALRCGARDEERNSYPDFGGVDRRRFFRGNLHATIRAVLYSAVCQLLQHQPVPRQSEQLSASMLPRLYELPLVTFLRRGRASLL